MNSIFGTELLDPIYKNPIIFPQANVSVRLNGFANVIDRGMINEFTGTELFKT